MAGHDPQDAAAPSRAVGAALTAALAGERLRIVAGLIRTTGDWELAEDCLQDAAERALAHWPADGIPDNPAGWLRTTAQRRALDLLRRRRTELRKVQEVQAMDEPTRRDEGADRRPGPPTGDVLVGPGGAVVDDRLVLLFACCHPALPLAGRVALTCKTVTGMSTRQVARAFLVSEATMSQRLLRTRNKIAHAGIAFAPPPPHRLAERTAGVLAVIYLLFNEGYTTLEARPAGEPDLAAEAIDLAALVSRLLPDDPETHALLALLRLQHSRRAARLDDRGDLVPMEEQDRTRWDRAMIDAGLADLRRARAAETPGRPAAAGTYRLQAEIAALHATPATAAETDWPRVVALYDLLLTGAPSPVTALNRAVAVGFADGPDAGLAALGTVADDPRLSGYRQVEVVRADLLRRAGRMSEAAAAYRRALGDAESEAERRFLRRRLRELGG